MLLEFIGKFLPISFLVVYSTFKKNKEIQNPHKWFFLLWVISVLFAIYLPAKGFAHYTIQLMLPLSLLAGIFFHPKFKKDRITSAIFSGKTGIVLLATIVIALQFLSLKDDYLKTDPNREVASHIEKQLEPGDHVFVSNYEQIIYYLLGIDSPTKFIHASLLFVDIHKSHIDNQKSEIRRILNTLPKFVLVQRKNEFVEDLIKDKYRLDAKFRNNEILVFKRIKN